MTNQEFIYEIVKIIAKSREKYMESLYFTYNSSTMAKIDSLPDDYIRVYVNCNDIFWWGCSDCEEITEENIKIFEQSLKDSKFAGDLLFCARSRKMRPQGVVYRSFDAEDFELFNQAGPEREIDFNNPYNQENIYMYKNDQQKGRTDE